MRHMCRRRLVVTALCVALFFGAGCQTFRTSQLEDDKALDHQVGAAIDNVAELGMSLYQVLHLVWWFR